MESESMCRYKYPEKKRTYAREYSKKRHEEGIKGIENKKWQRNNLKYWRDIMRKRKHIPKDKWRKE